MKRGCEILASCGLWRTVRLAILEQLALHGPTTATELADQLQDQPPANCSWHLPQLARYGYVEEAGTGPGRQRRWRVVLEVLESPPFSEHDDEPPELARATDEFTDMLTDRAVATLRAWRSIRRSEPKRWRDASFSVSSWAWPTADETAEFHAEFTALVERLIRPTLERSDPANRPPGCRPAQLVGWLVPGPDVRRAHQRRRPVRRRLLWAQVRALAEDGCAVVLVTHDVVEAERAVDRLVILDQGRVVAHGTPAELRGGRGGALRLEAVAASSVICPGVGGRVRHRDRAGTGKEQGLLDYQRSMPVPRLAMLAADAVIWVASALPGLAVTLVVAILRFDLEVSVSPWVIPAILLVSTGAAAIGYGIAYTVKPVLVGLITNLVIVVSLMFAPVNYPAERLPGWAQAVHEWLPFQYMAQAIRETVDVSAGGVAPCRSSS